MRALKKLTLCYEADEVLDQAVLEELESIGGGSSSLVSNLVEIFESTADETLGRAREGAQAHDLQNFSESVHKLKGSSGSIGALALFNCCKEVDKLVKQKLVDAAELDGLTDCIFVEYNRAKESLHSYLDKSR